MKNKKKIFGFIYGYQKASDLKRTFSNEYFNIKNISSHFNEVYILNLTNLYLFKKKIKFSNKVFKKFNFKKNIKFFNPNSFNELKKILNNKSFYGLVTMERTISELYIYYRLRKFDIKFFQVSNVGNAQYGDNIIKNNFIRSSLSIYWGRFNHKLYILLNIFGITPKIEIRFLSNLPWIKLSNKKNSFKNKIIKYFNLSFAKKLVSINSRAYDLFHQNEFPINEKYIVLLDEPMDDPQYVKIRGYTDKNKLKLYYKNLIEKLEIISKYYKKKIIVCIHPSDSLEIKKKIFSKFQVKKYQTRKYVYQSKIVLFFESSAIIDAVMLKKKIVTIKSKALDENQMSHNLHYVKEIKIPMLDIDKKLNFDKKTISKFKYNKKNIKKNYNTYIKKYIAPDDSNILGHKKISNTIKKNYF